MIFGNRSMDTVRRPLCGVLCFRAWWEASSENPWAFGGCLPPARPEKAWPFQAGQSPCTKHPRLSSFAFTPRKKFLRVPRGVFSKTPLGRGGTASHKERASQPARYAFSGGTKSLHETPQIVQLRLYAPKKVFEGSKGRFFKNAPWQGVGQRPTKRESEPACKVRLFRRDRLLYETPTDRPALPLRTEKVFEGSKGRFFKNAPLAGSGTASHGNRVSHRDFASDDLLSGGE